MTNERHEQLLRIWQSVEETDPNHVKEFSRSGGFKGSAVNTEPKEVQ